MKIKLTETFIKNVEVTGERYDVRDVVVPGLVLRVNGGGSLSYSVDYRINGRRTKMKIGDARSVPLAQAREIARARLGEVAAGNDIVRQKREKAKELQRKRLMSLGVFLEEKYLPWRRAERKRADEEEKRIRLHFESWFDLPMDEISADRLLEWRRQRINKGISAKTVNRDIACLRSVIRYALVLGTLAENPLEQVKALKVDERSHVRFLSESEELSLRTQLDLREQDKIRRRKSYNATLLGKGQKSRNGSGERKRKILPEYDPELFVDHLKPLVLLMLNTGIRPGEALRIEWCDVSLKGRNKTLRVRGEIAKSGQTRYIPLSQEAVEVLEKWKKSGPGKGLIFPGKGGNPMSRSPKALYRVIDKAGLKNFSPKDSRHSFASKLAMHNTDLNTIRDLLGHESINTTLIYAHLSDDHRRKTIDKVFGG